MAAEAGLSSFAVSSGCRPGEGEEDDRVLVLLRDSIRQSPGRRKDVGPPLRGGLAWNGREGNEPGRLGEHRNMAAAICSGQRGQVEDVLAGMARREGTALQWCLG